MNGVSIASGPLGFAQERDIGLGDVGMDVLQPDAHGTHGNGKILETGEQVEEMVGGQGQFGRLDA